MSADGTTTDDPTLAKLAEIRARRAALAEARDKRAQPTPAEQLAIEQRELATDEALEAAEIEHGRDSVECVRTDAGNVIVKRPHLATFRRFQDAGKSDAKTLDLLVRPCLVYPDKATFDQLCERLPFMLNLCADAVARLAGVRMEQQQAKP